MSSAWTRVLDVLYRAFSSFLAVPTGVVGLFVLLAYATYSLDHSKVGWLRPTRDFMQDHVFADAAATSSLLSTIAGGIITITSITFSLLLLALQQSAGSMTHQVFDQFLRRRLNQAYFGFFVGMAVYSLITLATVDPPFNPVFGATLALILTMVALYVLLLLIYSTINQMRPTEILQSIHDHTLLARERQLPMIQKTHRAASLPAVDSIFVHADGEGFIDFDVDAMGQAIQHATAPAEVVLLHAIGTYVAYSDAIAEVRSSSQEDLHTIVEAVKQATRITQERRLDTDPAYGIEQMENIAWRSISTSQQNPAPGITAIRNLRDLLARWADQPGSDSDKLLPVVYPDDVPAQLLAAFESLAVVASEAMQHQTYAEIVRAFTLTFDRLPPEHQSRIEELMLRTLPALGDHVLTKELDVALEDMARRLEANGRFETAMAVRSARGGLATTIGKLNSRSTRVPSG